MSRKPRREWLEAAFDQYYLYIKQKLKQEGRPGIVWVNEHAFYYQSAGDNSINNKIHGRLRTFDGTPLVCR